MSIQFEATPDRNPVGPSDVTDSVHSRLYARRAGRSYIKDVVTDGNLLILPLLLALSV
jgi:hypothetical protein